MAPACALVPALVVTCAGLDAVGEAAGLDGMADGISDGDTPPAAPVVAGLPPELGELPAFTASQIWLLTPKVSVVAR
jgi:hypothetical protein